MAILTNLNTGIARSTTRTLPSLFEGRSKSGGWNRNIRRYRLIGGGEPELCTGAICESDLSEVCSTYKCNLTICANPPELND